MEASAIEQQQAIEYPAELAEFLGPRWYAAYTCANHEKRVAEQLDQKSVEHFLPLYETVRRWKDRRVRLQLPLFPGYVFLRLALRDRLTVLRIPSVVRLVGFNGHPTPLPEGEIEALRDGLSHNLRAQPYPFLTVGRRVRVRSGPLQGFEGILMRHKGKSRIILSMDLILRAIIVEVESTDLEPIPGPTNASQAWEAEPSVATSARSRVSSGGPNSRGALRELNIQRGEQPEYRKLPSLTDNPDKPLANIASVKG